MKIKKPAVKKTRLILIAGLLWSGVGIMLISMAFSWLIRLPLSFKIEIMVAGLVLASIAAWFGLKRIAEKNISRILAYPGKVCVFAFQEWKSYILILIMVGLGLTLRKSHIISITWLTLLYLSMGLALFLASLRYHYQLISVEKK